MRQPPMTRHATPGGLSRMTFWALAGGEIRRNEIKNNSNEKSEIQTPKYLEFAFVAAEMHIRLKSIAALFSPSVPTGVDQPLFKQPERKVESSHHM